MSELQVPFDHAPVSETRISAFPLPGWRLALIETLPRAVDGKLGWTVILCTNEATAHSGMHRRTRRVQTMSTIGLFHAWDQAIDMAKQSDRERQTNER